MRRTQAPRMPGFLASRNNTFECYLGSSPSRVARFAHLSGDSFLPAFARVKQFPFLLRYFISRIVMFFIVTTLTKPFNQVRLCVIAMMSKCKTLFKASKAVRVSFKFTGLNEVINSHSDAFLKFIHG
jgi:hypothetical protein